MSEHIQLKKRLTWSALFIGVTVYAIFGAPKWVFLLAVEAFVLLGLWEYFGLAERKGFFINRHLGLFFGFLLPLQFYFSGETIVLIAALLSLCVFNFKRNLREQALISTALTFFGLMYVAWSFSFLGRIRYLWHGSLWVFYCIFIIKLGDMAAYFIGKRFGRHKYAGSISPNKSVEGAVAGFVATFAASILSKAYLPNVSVWDLAVLGMVLGVIGQIGDLIESLLKRDTGLKDSGTIPGLGGILDMIDSLLPAIPVVYYYLTALRGF